MDERIAARSRHRARLNLTRFAVVLLVGGLVAGCAAGRGGSTATPDPGALRVVATTTVLADLVGQVGGGRVAVRSVVPKGGEVHTFDPSPSDVATVGSAELVVLNGLGLDEWLAQLVVDAGSSAPVVELGEDLDSVEYLVGGEHEEPEGQAGHDAAVNPHLWLDVAYARRYVDRIAESLASADPEGADAYAAGAAAYGARLDALDAEIQAAIDRIPAANRKLVSFHEAYPYYAAAYGLEVVGVIVDAPGQDPSAGEIAALVEAIRTTGARAVFTEAQFSPDLAETVANEAGVEIVSDLYNDSLGDPPIDTYEGMMRWNTQRTVEALT